MEVIIVAVLMVLSCAALGKFVTWYQERRDERALIAESLAYLKRMNELEQERKATQPQNALPSWLRPVTTYKSLHEGQQWRPPSVLPLPEVRTKPVEEQTHAEPQFDAKVRELFPRERTIVSDEEVIDRTAAQLKRMFAKKDDWTKGDDYPGVVWYGSK